jgi:hypothetical protein
MPKYKVAHIHEQGQDVIIFLLEAKIDLLTDSDKGRNIPGRLGDTGTQAWIKS